MTQAEWIAADWGTSHLRVWAMAPDGTVLDSRTSDDGMGRTPRDGFEPALIRLIEGWSARGSVLPVVICGMAGSRQGWHEAPYVSVPAAPPGSAQAVRVPTAEAGLAAFILPGMKQERPADVMRGEETQIAGFLARNPGFDGVICLPGTHTKWARISAGEVVSFQTYMTGELYDLLGHGSVLRHSVGEGWDDTAFAAALSDAMAHPARVAAALFRIRSESLLHGLATGAAAARLSGLLLGLELAGSKPYWLGERVAVIGAERLAGLYGQALREQGVAAEQVPVGDLTLAGLAAAWSGLKETV